MFTHRKLPKAKWQHENAANNFDYTTVTNEYVDNSNYIDQGPTAHQSGEFIKKYKIH